jgi:small multidrug resistance family-3 protein
VIREILTTWTFLALAALLESGGDAGIRMGIRGQKWGFLAGPVALVLYGFVVNLSRWDFSRLMGVYIAIFFVVSQAIAVWVFRERLQAPALVGGALIVAGGLILTFWRQPVG